MNSKSEQPWAGLTYFCVPEFLKEKSLMFVKQGSKGMYRRLIVSGYGLLIANIKQKVEEKKKKRKNN